jgi:peptidoglycan/LPS O-acetylase OafA/YrhL
MQLFFLLSGYLSMALLRHRGVRGFVRNRVQRIALPLALSCATVLPVTWIAIAWASDGRSPGDILERIAGLPAVIRWMVFPLLSHLWFLWFLCWMVAAFALLAWLHLLPTGRHRWWFVPLSLLPQLFMGQSMSGFFGPDTSFGLIPIPHLVLFYGCFYFFGVATFAAEGMDTRLGARWPLLLPAVAVLFVAGIAMVGIRPADALLQPAYAWAMSLALIGLFHARFPHPSRWVAWLADASYWMYLAHVPLVLTAQMVVREWSLPGDVKFFLILAAVTAALLVSYAWCIRPTIIGRILNGPRGSPQR